MFTVLQTEEFVAWLDDLKESIEGEVSELRVNYGPGYRLYFARRGRIIVVILNAGDKSTQKRDIRRALKLAAELGEDL